MRIQLIYPLLSRRRAKVDENKQFWPPLGLAYVAGVLEREGHEVRIMDRDVLLRKLGLDFDLTDKKMLEDIDSFRPDYIGISATSPNVSDVGSISKKIKGEMPNIPIILGGPHVTAIPEETLNEFDRIDIGIIGEGERTILEIVRGDRLDSIKGIAFRRDGRVTLSEGRAQIDNIDDLPMPARHLLDMDFYLRPSRFTSRNLSLRTTSIFTARGCPYRCNFCAGPVIFPGKVRYHSKERVLSEIDELVDRYNVEGLYFAEDMFLSHKERAIELLEGFLNRPWAGKLKWFAQARVNVIDKEMLDLMKKCGCVGVEYGFESGSQRVLGLMNKLSKVEENIKAAELTRKAGLRFQANIIVGYPGEKEEDFRETIKFLKNIKPNNIGFNIFMPLPGTPSYSKLKSENKPLPRWDDIGDQEMPQINFADMPEGIFEKLYLEARLRVILPMNLRAFLADNKHDPLRLLRVAITQSKGLLIKTARMIYRLVFFKVSKEPDRQKVLYLSYNGLLEPIAPSQVVSYLKALAGRDFEFILVTFEKGRDLKTAGREGIMAKKEDLRSSGIEWHYLRYHKNPPGLSTIFDLIAGSLYLLFTIPAKRIKIVHLRGVTPGIAALFLSSIFKVKIVFDMRGLLAEEYVGGGLWNENSAIYNMVKWAEEKTLKRADVITVLTDKHLAFNKTLPYLKESAKPMHVIPCCVDTARFDYGLDGSGSLKRELGLDGKFILMYPGKVGTFYLMKEMLDFYRKMSSMISNSVFLIMTNDFDAPILRTGTNDLGNEKLIIMKGVDFKDMPKYTRLADAGIFFINPYKKIGSSPIKMGEFLSSGVPVIINPGIGDTEELVKANKVGVVVTDFRDSCYSEAVKALMGLKAEGEVLKKRCRDTAQRYLSLANGAQKYYEIYKALSV